MPTGRAIELARQLHDARIQRTPVTSFAARHPDLTVAEGFQIQRHLISLRLDAGEKIVGWKIGALSAVAREQMGMHEPFLGPIFSNEVHASGSTIETSHLIAPGAEPEIAFRFKHRISGPGASADDTLSCIEGALAALELVDCRFSNWQFSAADIPADCGCTAGAVLSDKVISLDTLELTAERVEWFRNDNFVATETGAAVGGSPLSLVPWLINKLADWDLSLETGDVVLAGALLPHIKPKRRDRLTASFEHLGIVSATFI